MLVLPSVPPIDLLAEERQETFQLRKELSFVDRQEITRAKEAIHTDGRRRLVEKWQMRWYGEQTWRWTYRLIPELATWLNRKHGGVGFYLVQTLSGRGSFNAYLKRFKKKDEEVCCYCDFPVDTHSSSAQNGVWQGRPSLRQWVPSLLLTQWSLSCSSLSGSGPSSSHSSDF